MDMRDFMRMISEDAREEEFENRTDAYNTLDDFCKKKRGILKEGDYIQRNQYGKSSVKYPTDNQAAIVVKAFDEMQYDNGDVYDMIIAVALRPNSVMHYHTDSRFYEKASSEGGANVIGFKKK